MNPKDAKPPVVVKVGDYYYWTGFYKDKEDTFEEKKED